MARAEFGTQSFGNDRVIDRVADIVGSPAEAVDAPIRRLISIVCGTAFSRG